jgi:hypothetical protein
MSWSGGGGSVGPTEVFILDKFSPTGGQTAFTLTSATSSPSTVLAWVNGTLYENGVDYNVVGSGLTWTNATITLGPPDRLQVYYQV